MTFIVEWGSRRRSRSPNWVIGLDCGAIRGGIRNTVAWVVDVERRRKEKINLGKTLIVLEDTFFCLAKIEALRFMCQYPGLLTVGRSKVERRSSLNPDRRGHHSAAASIPRNPAHKSHCQSDKASIRSLLHDCYAMGCTAPSLV
jgi:hypothetical protein